MKKLLCVLLFGMVFGQDAITTREYTIAITQDTESINIYDLIGTDAEGMYSVQLIHFGNVNMPNDCGYIFDEYWQDHIDYHFVIFDSITNSSNLHCGNAGNCDCAYTRITLIVNEEYPNIYISQEEYMFSVDLIFYVEGRFDDTDVGLNGDMNDDGELDVLDVVSLVQEILGGGMGDVGNLINIVRG